MNRLETLDQELAQWQAASAAALANICALYEHPVYRALAGKLPGKPVTFVGDSQSRADKAVGFIGSLLMLVSNLSNTIKQATELRHSLPKLFQGDRIGEIEHLLRGPSVPTPPPDAAPLPSRRLLDESHVAPRMLTPAQVLDKMQPEFDFARDTIFAVSRAWTDLPVELDRFEADIKSLEGLAGKLGDAGSRAAVSTLAELKLGAQDVRRWIQRDPFKAVELLEKRLLTGLALVRGNLEMTERERQEAGAALCAARALVPQLIESHARADAASADCSRRISIEPSPATPLDETAFNALGGWLERLAAQIEGGGDWRAARIGLHRWHEQAQIALATDHHAQKAAESLLSERLALRGWLDALHAKAGAHSLNEDTELNDALGQARELLYTRPTPMALARERVARYQTLVNDRIRKL